MPIGLADSAIVGGGTGGLPIDEGGVEVPEEMMNAPEFVSESVSVERFTDLSAIAAVLLASMKQRL